MKRGGHEEHWFFVQLMMTLCSVAHLFLWSCWRQEIKDVVDYCRLHKAKIWHCLLPFSPESKKYINVPLISVRPMRRQVRHVCNVSRTESLLSLIKCYMFIIDHWLASNSQYEATISQDWSNGLWQPIKKEPNPKQQDNYTTNNWSQKKIIWQMIYLKIY